MNAVATGRDEPIFIHSWWRTSSTYVWGKLRQLNSLCCYSEPLHEIVGQLTMPMVRGVVDDKAVALLHHPPMQRPYFSEYEPLVRKGDMVFRKELSYDRYLLFPQETDEDLARYLGNLMRVAREQGQRPLLAMVRSSLRASWMHRQFGGVHVALLRNPRDQWGSMLEQHRQGGSYFLAGVLAVASKLGTRVPRAFAHIPCKLVDYRGPNYNPVELGRYITMAKDMDPSTAYALFVLIWLASALQILSVSRIAIDSDRMSGDPAARAQTEALLAAAGMPVDFSDFATPKYAELPLAPDVLESIEARAIEALARNALPLVIYSQNRINQRLDALAPFTAQLVTHALSAITGARRGN